MIALDPIKTVHPAITHVIVSLFFLSSSTMVVVSQERADWIVFRSPSQSFSIRLPQSPITVGAESGKISDELKLFWCAKPVAHYSLPSIFASDRARLLIREIDVGGCSLKKGAFAAEVTSFLEGIAGPAARFHRDQLIHNDGFEGREVLYPSGRNYRPGSKIYNRILAVHSEDRLLIVLYFRQEGTIGEEEDIFRSLKLINEGRKKGGV